MDKTTGMAILQPILQDLILETDLAMKDFRTMTHGRRHAIRAGTQAGLIRDGIVTRFKARFDRPPNTFYAKCGLLDFLVFPDQAKLLVKKLKYGHLPGYYPTRQASFLYENDECLNDQLQLPGIPSDLPMLVWGYRPNRLGDGYAGLWVVHMARNKVDWHERVHAVHAPVATIGSGTTTEAKATAPQQGLRRRGDEQFNRANNKGEQEE